MNTYYYNLNNRALTVDSIVAMIHTIESVGLLPGESVLVSKDNAESNAAEYFAAICENQHGEKWREKTVKILGQSYSLEHLTDKLKTITGKGPRLIGGHKRKLAEVLKNLLTGSAFEFPVVKVDPETEAALEIQDNDKHDLASGHSKMEKLAGVVALRREGIITGPSQVIAKNWPESQKLYEQASLVIMHDVTLDKASKLTYVQAKEAQESKEHPLVPQAVDAIIAGKAGKTKGMLPSKIITREVERLDNASVKEVPVDCLHAILEKAEEKLVRGVNEAIRRTLEAQAQE